MTLRERTQKKQFENEQNEKKVGKEDLERKKKQKEAEINEVPGFFEGTVVSIIIMSCCPLLVFYYFFAIRYYGGAFTGPAVDFYQNYLSAQNEQVKQDYLNRFNAMLPTLSYEAIMIYTGWFLFQLALAFILPSKQWQGRKTFAGNILTYYHVNGLYAWAVTHFLFIVLSFHFKLFSPGIIYDYWKELLLVVNLLGYIGTALFYVKARLFPSDTDVRVTGHFFFDLYMGCELNPRIGNFDIKLFLNGRPGIVAWTLINFSMACKQYEIYGFVTNSMILLNILHAIYVLDFFYYEGWYLGTIDIIHDRLGFYLNWGDLTWLPYMYTLQSHYLVHNPYHMSWVEFTFVAILGVAGYYIFRAVNNQKDFFRQTKGKEPIWGSLPKAIPASYFTPDGQYHETAILASGWWGLSRHFNYVGDLCMCLAFCLCCGFEHFTGYFYVIYMLILLVHRSYRDDQKCLSKYGKSWEEYQRLVPYRIFPYIY